MLAMYVTDTTVHAIMGGRFKEQDTLLRYVDEAVRLVGGFSLPDLFPSSRLALAMSSTLRKAAVFRDSLMAFMDRVIGEHLERKSSDDQHQEDLIDVLLRIQGEDNLQFPLTMSNINAVTFVSCSILPAAAASTSFSNERKQSAIFPIINPWFY